MGINWRPARGAAGKNFEAITGKKGGAVSAHKQKTATATMSVVRDRLWLRCWNRAKEAGVCRSCAAQSAKTDYSAWQYVNPPLPREENSVLRQFNATYLSRRKKTTESGDRYSEQCHANHVKCSPPGRPHTRPPRTDEPSPIPQQP